ncbi:MAG: hypothetical protein QOJ52_2952 [Acidimicrobiaceae bacterium]|nr:hypothetical protein [Acidimicrobiaceae bacterium]
MATALALLVAAGCSSSKKSVSTGPVTTTAESTTTSPESTTTTVAGGSGSTGVTVTVAPTTRVTTVTTPTTPTTPTTLRPRSSPPVQVNLSSADYGRTVPVRVGDTVRLLLQDPATTNWTQVSDSPTGLLAPAPAPAPPAHSQLVIWTAMHPGTVLVTAVGVPICVTSVCPMYARDFRVTIVIS